MTEQVYEINEFNEISLRSGSESRFINSYFRPRITK
jgi:hypothetical protein